MVVSEVRLCPIAYTECPVFAAPHAGQSPVVCAMSEKELRVALITPGVGTCGTSYNGTVLYIAQKVFTNCTAVIGRSRASACTGAIGANGCDDHAQARTVSHDTSSPPLPPPPSPPP